LHNTDLNNGTCLERAEYYETALPLWLICCGKYFQGWN